jgi:hypothetical protein
MTQPNDPTGVTPPPADDTPPQWASPVPPNAATGSPSAPPVAPYPGAAGGAAVAPVTPVRQPARRRGVIDIVLVVAAIFALGGVGFALGRLTAPASQADAAGSGRFQAQLPNGGQGGNGGTGTGQGGFGAGAGGIFGAGGSGVTLTGEVTEVAADHITLKLASGQTIQIPIDASTAYHSQAAASASDVTTGSAVEVQVARGGGAPGTGNGGTGNGGTGGGQFTLGAATSVTVIPK